MAKTNSGRCSAPFRGLIDEYGGTPEQRTELRDLFSLTGAGNSPRMVGFLHNLCEGTVGGGQAHDGRPACDSRTNGRRDPVSEHEQRIGR